VVMVLKVWSRSLPVNGEFGADSAKCLEVGFSGRRRAF
jgi:hypothetical protein